jgi:hypothetical protein
MAENQGPAKATAKFKKDGAVEIRLGGHTFNDPDEALRAADSLRDVALQAHTVRAGLIAEEKALVGSASHHMDRGASAAFHYDRRAAHTGIPLQEGDLDIGSQEEPDPFSIPGNSAATGVGPASDAAIERNDETANVRRELVESDVLREKLEEREHDEAEERVEKRLKEQEKEAKELDKEAEERGDRVELEQDDPQEAKSVKPAATKEGGPSRQTPSGRTGQDR